MGTYFVPRSRFYRSRLKTRKASDLPSWRVIAHRLATALRACDWSFGRAQTNEIHERLESALALLDKKEKVAKHKRKI